MVNRDNHKFSFDWKLSDTIFGKDKGTSFSCFAGCGGSSMGFKRAGFDVIGCNEIDPKMMSAYRKNLKPKYSYLESIEAFKLRDDLPDELYHLDVLEGSPPCSSYSFAGARDKHWGKKKKFNEGQAEQVLDTLFFDYIDLAEKLRPKVCVAENVVGITLGKAKRYMIEIYDAFDKAGYTCEHFILDASKMGVPQRRESVFFLALRKDLAKPLMRRKDLFTELPEIEFDYNESDIPFGEIEMDGVERKAVSAAILKRWKRADEYGMDDQRSVGGVKFGYFHKLMKWRVCATIMAGGAYTIEDTPHYVSDEELIRVGSFPSDYDFGKVKVQYAVGMSVPPTMAAQVATNISEQWLERI